MHLSNVPVLHVSEGQSYACIGADNIVNVFKSLDDAARQMAAATVAAPAPAAPHTGQRQVTHVPEADQISTRPMGSQGVLGLHQGHAPTQGMSHVNARSVPHPPATTLRQRIEQMQRNPQTPSQTGPKGSSAGQQLGLSHVLQQAAQPNPVRANSLATPTHSTQNGGSQIFTPAAPWSVSTQPYSSAPSQPSMLLAALQRPEAGICSDIGMHVSA